LCDGVSEDVCFAIAPTCIISGLLQTVGIPVLPKEYRQLDKATGDMESNLMSKADACVARFRECPSMRFAFVHVKGVDDAGHDRRLDLKIALLQKVDAMVSAIIQGLQEFGEDVVICVTGDHSTPVATGDHSHEPVPVSICSLRELNADNGQKSRDDVSKFSEIDAVNGCLGRFRGLDLMHMIKWYQAQK
jgi:2,3-diphosphopglycerate-independent phosphoglycerate mutase